MTSLKISPDKEEINKIIKMEDTIHDMLNKIMEENDSLEYFGFLHNDKNDETQKIGNLAKNHIFSSNIFLNSLTKKTNNNSNLSIPSLLPLSPQFPDNYNNYKSLVQINIPSSNNIIYNEENQSIKESNIFI